MFNSTRRLETRRATAALRTASTRTVAVKTIAAIAAALVGLSLLAGCTSDPAESAATTAPAATAPAASEPAAGAQQAPPANQQDAAQSERPITREAIAALDAADIIEWLDPLPVSERPADLSVSIRPSQIVVSDSAGEATVPMPADEFYVSLAPYVNQNHDCYFHNLATCKGELANEAVRVVVTDQATGATVLDEQRTTYDNGFVGIWLPRGGKYDLVITAAAGSATAELSTADDDDLTCLTTLKLT
ncbi:hypothetical protein GCM10010401_19190 [Rarobacter faecitabidus]|uniref:Uncharacterized protein n=1 Tax=Rarobacter faecitabidus TaxID=13243 RepID=A0A542ZV42_RARFA|nr:CueP family metal-binding protein [Rarobacter faecitabidus]TQL64126.1 hypothetical protein FB461_0617 [Rarobacter faecitabidus]